jgi:hypothetical protein
MHPHRPAGPRQHDSGVKIESENSVEEFFVVDANNTDTEYLTPADVGRIADVTPGAVRAQTARGRLPVAAVTAGGMHLYTRETAERYAAERAQRKRYAAERAARRGAAGGGDDEHRSQ